MSIVRRLAHPVVAGLIAALALAALGAGAGPPRAAAATTPTVSPYAGGQGTPAGEYPFMTGIRMSGATAFFCSGSLVAPDWVLTAAHCVDGGLAPWQLEAVVGENDLDDGTDPAQRHFVDRIEIHGRWGGDDGDAYDVAMIHLTTPSAEGPIIFGVPRPLRQGLKRCRTQALVQPFPANLLPCPAGGGFALGWGRTPTSGGTTSRKLIQAPAVIYDQGRKKTFWTTKTGACPGDSGGPLLVRREDGVLLQIGVASHIRHGGGWFDWLLGGQCSRRSQDWYSDVSGGALLTWMETFL